MFTFRATMTRSIYKFPEDIFRNLRNLISIAHFRGPALMTRLFFASLFRVPRLIWLRSSRRSSTSTTNRWPKWLMFAHHLYCTSCVWLLCLKVNFATLTILDNLFNAIGPPALYLCVPHLNSWFNYVPFWCRAIAPETTSACCLPSLANHAKSIDNLELAMNECTTSTNARTVFFTKTQRRLYLCLKVVKWRGIIYHTLIIDGISV